MSEASARAEAFVSAHLAQARMLGQRLADLTGQPELFVDALSAGLATLADPAYTEMSARVSPEVQAELMVRGPLVAAIGRPLTRALREDSSISALMLAQRLIDSPLRSVRLFAMPCLRRALPEDPEQTWQLMRRMAHGAADWIEVDTLAQVWARGVLAERFRWAELEQLVYSQQRFERRLVGATLATLPHHAPSPQRDALRGVVARALALLRRLMGDAEVMVQKALSWAIREWTPIDPEAIAAFLQRETAIAVEHRDGARAWVVRDSLTKQPLSLADTLRLRLVGVRRDPGAPSTSIASTEAAAFAATLVRSHDAVALQGARYTRSRA